MFIDSLSGLFLHIITLTTTEMESSMNSLLELHNIYYSYHTLDAETRALSDLSFSRATWNLHSSCRSFRMRQIYTSLPDLWLMKPNAGEILLNGIPLKENSPVIGYMLQHDHLLDWRSIYLECHPRSGNLRHTEYCNQKTCV